DFVRSYNQSHGATVLITSHNMADVAALCQRVIAIDKGKLAFDGALADLARRTGSEKRVVLRVAGEPNPAVLAELDATTLEDGSVVLTAPHAAVSAVVGKALASLEVVDLT